MIDDRPERVEEIKKEIIAAASSTANESSKMKDETSDALKQEQIDRQEDAYSDRQEEENKDIISNELNDESVKTQKKVNSITGSIILGSIAMVEPIISFFKKKEKEINDKISDKELNDASNRIKGATEKGLHDNIKKIIPYNFVSTFIDKFTLSLKKSIFKNYYFFINTIKTVKLSLQYLSKKSIDGAIMFGKFIASLLPDQLGGKALRDNLNSLQESNNNAFSEAISSFRDDIVQQNDTIKNIDNSIEAIDDTNTTRNNAVYDYQYDQSKNYGGAQQYIDDGSTSAKREASETVKDAIRVASKKVGVDYGTMMAIAAQESGFNPNNRNKDTGAAGLFQFIPSTWSMITRKYSNQYPELKLGAYNPYANAIAGALYIKKNSEVLGTTDATALYAAHFLGTSGGERLLKESIQNPNAIAASIFPKPARKNQAIFYDKSGRPRTVAEVRDVLFNKVGKYASYYNSQAAPVPISPYKNQEDILKTKKTTQPQKKQKQTFNISPDKTKYNYLVRIGGQ